jgi:radical SAM protein with 4Fe4S-binding SPASM domain
LDNFKKIIDKLGPYLIHIDLVNWGEPLLNENIFDMVRYAKKYHPDIKIDTNLTCLDEGSAEKLIASGLDKIVVSIDGLTRDTYSKYRIGGDFDKAMNNLKLLIRKRRKLKSLKPYITWQFLVFRHNEHEIDSAIKMGRKLGVDHVGITNAFIGDKEWIPVNSKYSNYSDEVKKDNMTFDHFKSNDNVFCNWPWEAITINTNGSVSACCSVEEERDDFGNIFDQPFEELWNGDMYRIARRYIKDRDIPKKDRRHICVECRHLGLINIDILSCHSFFDKK